MILVSVKFHTRIWKVSHKSWDIFHVYGKIWGKTSPIIITALSQRDRRLAENGLWGEWAKKTTRKRTNNAVHTRISSTTLAGIIS